MLETTCAGECFCMIGIRKFQETVRHDWTFLMKYSGNLFLNINSEKYG